MSKPTRSTTQIVAEIFTEVGITFTRLGELENMLNPECGSKYNVSEADLRAIKAAVLKFGEDMDKLCRHIKHRTLLQIKNSMKRHAFEEAGIPLRKQQVVNSAKPAVNQGKTRSASNVISQPTAKSADITLNMLNATEQEVDVEGLSATDKLDYDSSDS